MPHMGLLPHTSNVNRGRTLGFFRLRMYMSQGKPCGLDIAKQVSMKKLISRSKKEMENFIQTKLRIITREAVFQKVLRTVLPVRGQSTVI